MITILNIGASLIRYLKMNKSQNMSNNLIQLIKKLQQSQDPHSSIMRKAYGRGINIAAQIDQTRKNYKDFIQIQQLNGYSIQDIGCGYMQSYYLLTDGQLVKSGYILDSLVGIRAFNYYRLMPWFFRGIQKIPFTKTFTFKGGDETLSLLNRQYILEGKSFTKAVFNQSGIHLFDSQNCMFVIGENYFGQRATGDSLTVESQMRKIDHLKLKINQTSQYVSRKIVDIALGFQHSIFITDKGEAFGCGKAVDYQIQPFKYYYSKDVTTLQKIVQPQLIFNQKKVVKAACGFRHSIILTQDNKLYGLGDNMLGQCGINYTKKQNLPKLQEIYFPLRNNQQILDIKCGFNHTFILTNFHLYFSGSMQHNQNPFSKFRQNVGAFTIVDLPKQNTLEDDRVIKIFSNFDRSAIITEKGKAYIFGGKNYEKVDGQSGKLEKIEGFSFNSNSLIGLGFSHTIIYP